MALLVRTPISTTCCSPVPQLRPLTRGAEVDDPALTHRAICPNSLPSSTPVTRTPAASACWQNSRAADRFCPSGLVTISPKVVKVHMPSWRRLAPSREPA